MSNRIVEVGLDYILRDSDAVRLPEGEGTHVTRAMVAQVWERLLAGEPTADAPVLYFTYALMAQLPGIAVRGPRDLVIADRNRALQAFVSHEETTAQGPTAAAPRMRALFDCRGEPLEPGQRVRQREGLHAALGGQSQGGISTPARHPVALAITDDAGLGFGMHRRLGGRR